jgi:hypothetical protein
VVPPASAAASPASRAGASRAGAERAADPAADPAIAERSAVVARVRVGLTSTDPQARLDAVSTAQRLRCPELEPDVAHMLESEPFVPARRVAVQVLAQGDSTRHEHQLRELKQDPDIIVQLNASFGLARGGDG